MKTYTDKLSSTSRTNLHIDDNVEKVSKSIIIDSNISVILAEPL